MSQTFTNPLREDTTFTTEVEHLLRFMGHQEKPNAATKGLIDFLSLLVKSEWTKDDVSQLKQEWPEHSRNADHVIEALKTHRGLVSASIQTAAADLGVETAKPRRTGGGRDRSE